VPNLLAFPTRAFEVKVTTKLQLISRPARKKATDQRINNMRGFRLMSKKHQSRVGWGGGERTQKGLRKAQGGGKLPGKHISIKR